MQNFSEFSPFHNNYSINIGGFLMDFSTPKVMGIVNLTPDSFYIHSRYDSEKVVLTSIEKMLEEGADIIDIGAFSSRPGAQLISEEEERTRLIPYLKEIIKHFPKTLISVDTYRSTIAKESINIGAAIINDISSGELDPQMHAVIAELNVPYIMMHMQNIPENMQDSPKYEDVFNHIYNKFNSKLNQLYQLGIKDIILDPGFGFGKTTEHNYNLLNKLQFFHSLNHPVLVGISRKGMIQKVINEPASKALNGTTVANTIALLNGANILRVHDVKAAKEAIQIVDFYQKQ